MESDNSDVSDEDKISDTDEKVEKSAPLLTVEPFEVVLKGGSPWGFTLKGGVEVRSPIQISEIKPDGKADVSDTLKLGDYVLGVNDVKCVSLTEAVQLIQSAFRTLTLLVWRGSPKLEPNVSILRTSSFLQRARELQELERNRLGSQDDTILPKDTSNSATVRSRQRRIESFHGTRRVKNNSSTSSLSSNSAHSSVQDINNKRQSPQLQSPQQRQPSPQYSSPHQQSPVANQSPSDNQQQSQPANHVSHDVKGDNSEQDMESATAAKLKGWATVGDLTQKHQRQLLLQQQQKLQSQHVATSVAPSNNVTLNQVQGHSQYPSGHLSPAMSSPSLNMSDHWKNVYGHGSPSGNNPMVPTSSPAITKQVMDIHEGYATTSTPRSPTNSTNYLPKFPNRPTNLNYTKTSGGSYGDHYNKGSYSYNNSRPSPHQHGSNMYVNDDSSVIKTSESSTSRKYERRSLPPQLNDYQNLKDLRSNPQSYGMLPPKEEEEGENSHSKQIDSHSPSSPPPPPRRDMSSLKYVQASTKNHEKYPSWPVTHPNMDMEAGEAITSQVGAWPVRDVPQGGEASTGDSYKPQLKPVNEGSNDSDRKNGEENKRNQSDPGFNKPNSFKGLSVKRPTPQEIQQSWSQNQKNTKQNNKSVDNFFLNNSPGYPKPLLDQDGNRIGDAKYMIPSPPERDVSGPTPDTKLLQEKLASMMAPNSRSGPYLTFDPSRVSDSMQENKDTKGKGFYPSTSGNPTSNSQSAITLQIRVDSSTSPLQSPMESKQSMFGASPSVSESKDRPSENLQQMSTPRGVIVKHMLYYNTGTQTDTNSQGSQTGVHVSSQEKDSILQEKSIQARAPDKDTRIESARNVSTSNFGTKYVQGLNENSKESRSSSESKDNYSEDDPQNYAPMIRKLSQEYMSGRMQVSDKRLSGDSGVSTVSATSPGSDMPPHSFGQFPGMREAESYNSIVIHPNETSHPFGKDYHEQEHESQGRKDSSKMELDRRVFSSPDSRVRGSKGRYSMDLSLSQKILPNKKSIQDTRYSSESNLQATYANQRMHSMSMSSLAPRHSKADSISEGQYLRPTYRSSNSSSSSRHGSDTRSSTSSYHGSLNSPIATGMHRVDSDSVFVDPDASSSSNVKQGDVSSPNVSQASDSGSTPSRRSIGRNESMKIAYGTYDEASSKFDDAAGQKVTGRQIVHGKSRSYSGDYMQMSNNQNRASLGQIREDSSEDHWTSIVNMSRSHHHNTTSSVSEESNYANIDPLKMEKNINPELIERTNLRRTSSEQIRPLSSHGLDEIRPPLPNRDSRSNNNSAMKHSKSDTWQKPVQSPTQSQSDLNNFQSPSSSQKDLNRESDTEVKKVVDPHTSSATVSQSQLDLDRRKDSYVNDKQKQRNALQDFMDRKIGKRLSDSDDTSATTPEELKPNNSSSQDRSSPKLTPTQSFKERYAKRQESLRRSRSITSRDSCDYVHMSRPSQPHPQTEWSKIRSQAQDGSKRPHSISSDISLVDPYAVTPITEASKQQDMEAHKRSKSDSTDVGTSQDLSQQGHEDSANVPTSRRYRQTRAPPPSHYRSGGSLSSNNVDYANMGYRRPPPPPPEDDKPPALPPRNYRHNSVGQLETNKHLSRTTGYMEPLQRGAPELQARKPREPSPDNYAEQLRKQYRRFSEQQNLKPTAMSVVSSKPITHCSQSQKRSSLEPQEATPPTTGTSMSSLVSGIPPHQTTYAATSNHVLMSQASSPNQLMTSSHVSPVSQSSPRSSVSHISTPVSLPLHVTPPKDNPNIIPQTASSQNYSPPMQLCSPELPPPPTPIKNPEDLAAIHNLDLPAPPPEVLSGESSLNEDDRCADDSYGSHKNKYVRQVGVYSRSKSTTLLTENNNYKQQIQKPPRRNLNDQGWRSENAINIPPLDLENNKSESEFEQTVTPTIYSRPLGNSQSSSSVMAPRAYMLSDNSRQPEVAPSEKEDADSPSVKDRIFRFEKKPSNSTGDNKDRRSPSGVNNLKKSFEDRTKPSDIGVDSPRQSNQYSSNRYRRSSRDHQGDKSEQSFTVEKKRMNYIGQYGVQGSNGFSHPNELPHRKGSAERRDDSVGALQRNSDSSENVHRQDVNSYNQNMPDRVSYSRPERPDISPNSRLKSSSHDRYNSDPTPPKVPERVPISHRPVPQPEAPSPVERSRSYSHHHSSSSSSDLSEGRNTPLSINHGRQPSQEELECNEKVQEFARQVKDKDKKLSEMLNQDDLGRMKFMSGIVPPAETPRKHSTGHSPQTSKLSTGSNEDAKVSTPNGVQDNSVDQDSYGRPKEKGSPPSTYWVSPSKAQIEIDIRNSEELGKKMTEDIVDPESLLRTKEELVSSIVKKMDKLKDEKSDLQVEIKEVDTVGKMVSETVEKKCKSQKEKDKFQSFLREMDHIIRLLLKMSGLLARAENALQSLPEDCDVHQKDIATQKRDRYKAQHEEAQKLKQDIDQRSTQILGILRESLSDQELEDYQYYIKMKSRLTVEHQNLEDKITLGQEQIQALRRSIPDKRH